MVVGFEDNMQICCAGEEFVVVRGDQRARRVSVGSEGPVGAQLDQQPVAMSRYGGVGGRVDADELAVAQLVDLVVEEVEARLSNVRSKPGVRSLAAATITSCSPAEQGLGIVERRSPSQRLTSRG